MFTKLTDHLLDESHHLFHDTCGRFAQREILPHAEAWEEAEGFPRELFSRAGAAGILGAELPEAYGGGGGDMLHALVSTEALLRGGSSGVWRRRGRPDQHPGPHFGRRTPGPDLLRGGARDGGLLRGARAEEDGLACLGHGGALLRRGPRPAEPPRRCGGQRVLRGDAELPVGAHVPGRLRARLGGDRAARGDGLRQGEAGLWQAADRIAAGAYLPGEVSMAKNFSAAVAHEVCHEAVQIFGGMGYMRETAVERLSRDVRLLSIGGGTTEIMNEVISKLLLH